jgi:hypothetical protein
MNHSLPSTAEVQNECSFISTPPLCLLVWTGETLHFLHITLRQFMIDEVYTLFTNRRHNYSVSDR